MPVPSMEPTQPTHIPEGIEIEPLRRIGTQRRSDWLQAVAKPNAVLLAAGFLLKTNMGRSFSSQISKGSVPQKRKKPTWRNTRQRYPATSAYSSTSLPAKAELLFT
jgi:hypothetical protein